MGIFTLFLFLGTLSRIIPHPANFTPIGAILIFYGAKRGYKSSIILGLSIMIISDLLLGMSFTTVFVYLGFIGYALTAALYNKRFGIVVAPVLSSILFFIVTNFGVWLGPWYTHDLNGLIKCFTLAIPFYRNTILGDIVFVFLIYLAYEISLKIRYKEILTHTEELWQQLSARVSLKKK